MNKKFSLLSIDDEPTDEQLHIIMADALQDVLDSKHIVQETYDRMMKEALENATEKGKEIFKDLTTQ